MSLSCRGDSDGDFPECSAGPSPGELRQNKRRAAAGSHGANAERCRGHGGPRGHAFHRSPPAGGHPHHTECKTSLFHTQTHSYTFRFRPQFWTLAPGPDPDPK
ncbi:hypothetical protein SRHO_G00254550 [Serrasalmus rhombeus]